MNANEAMEEFNHTVGILSFLLLDKKVSSVSQGAFLLLGCHQELSNVLSGQEAKF